MEIGIKSPRGKDNWNENSIRNMLTKDFYHSGEMNYEVKLLKNRSKEYCRKRDAIEKRTIKVPILIDKELNEKCKERLNTNRKYKRKHKYERLLFGKMYCGCCGSTYLGKVNPKANINVYQCQSSVKKYRDNNIKCENNSEIQFCYAVKKELSTAHFKIWFI